MPAALTTPEAFISHWQKAEANERANSQSFLIGLAHILGVPLPSNNHADGYSFDIPVNAVTQVCTGRQNKPHVQSI